MSTLFEDLQAGKVRADQLRPGDIVFTPAHRAETVTGVETGQYRTAVSTAIGSKSYVWHFDSWEELPTLQTSSCTAAVKVFLRDDGNLGVTAFVSTNPRELPPKHPLIGAGNEGRGSGWRVTDAATGTRIETLAAGLDKRAATARVRAGGKAHARRLGLPFEEVR